MPIPCHQLGAGAKVEKAGHPSAHRNVPPPHGWWGRGGLAVFIALNHPSLSLFVLDIINIQALSSFAGKIMFLQTKGGIGFAPSGKWRKGSFLLGP